MLALIGGVDLPHAVVREQVATAIDVVVQIAPQRRRRRSSRSTASSATAGLAARARAAASALRRGRA